jgi:hypothetical protein
MPTTETVAEHGSTKKIATRQQVGPATVEIFEFKLSFG